MFNFIYKICFFVILIFISPISLNAMIYKDFPASQKGLERGAEENFQSVGQIQIGTSDNKVRQCNAALISPNIIITVAHCFKDFHSDWGMFSTVHDTDSLNKPNAFHIYKGQYSRLDLRSMTMNPDTDLAIIKLMEPLNSISILPILKTDPIDWSSGYLSSFGDVMLNGNSELLKSNKRHIAINRITSTTCPESIGPIVANVANYTLPIYSLNTRFNFEGEIRSPLYHFPENSHQLSAATSPKDSGASFIVKFGKKLHLAGLHKGKFVGLDSANPENPFINNLIIPLFPYTDWIQEQIDLHR